MILFCDENAGTRVPQALHLVRLPVLWVVKRYGTGGVTDVRLLTDAGRNGWLVFSCNIQMLNVEEERDTLLREGVGIVFLTSGQEHIDQVLRVLLNKWRWLEQIVREVPRPFAFTMTINGATKQVPIAPLRRTRGR